MISRVQTNGTNTSQYDDLSTIQVQFFEVYLINSLRFSEVIFPHFASRVRLFFVDKRKPIIFRLKNAMERGIRENVSLS